MYKKIYEILKKINSNKNFTVHQSDIEVIDSILKLNTELTKEGFGVIKILENRLYDYESKEKPNEII